MSWFKTMFPTVSGWILREPHVPVLENFPLRGSMSDSKDDSILKSAMKFAHSWRSNHDIKQSEWVILYLSSDSWFELTRWGFSSRYKVKPDKITYPGAKVIFKLKPSKEEELRAWKDEVES